MNYILGYKPGLKSVRQLRKFPGIRSIKHQGSKFKPAGHKMVINWGACKSNLILEKCRVLNHPIQVSEAANKLHAFENMEAENVSTVPFTTDVKKAEEWIREGSKVMCRTLLRGKGGDGIVVAKTVDELVKAPLYTRYQKSKSEWRVHVFNEGILEVNRKVRNPEVPDEDVDWDVRNHDRGFIFQRNNDHVPQCVRDASIEAVKALGLDFGAVDVLYNQHYDKAYVLEINCAPNIEGSLVERYAEAIQAA